MASNAFRGKNVARRSEGDQARAIDERDRIRELSGFIEIVQHRKHRFARVGQAAHQAQRALRVVHVEIRRRFVEQ